jgi:hypothetical protein
MLYHTSQKLFQILIQKILGIIPQVQVNET